MKQQNRQFEKYEGVVARRVTSGRLRRVVAMLSAFVLFTTMNTLKFDADTLERIATCGIEAHVHAESCYDEAGALICGLEEHIHTDACYQQRPTAEDAASTRIDEYVPLNNQVTLASAIEVEDEEVEDFDIPPVDETVSETETEYEGSDVEFDADDTPVTADDSGDAFTLEGAPDNTDDEIIDDEITEDEITEDDITDDDEITEDDITDDDEITEDEITEDEITEDEITEDENTTEDETTEDEDNAEEEITVTDEPAVYTYPVGSQAEVRLSAILSAVGLELDGIADVGAANSDADRVAIAATGDGDYTVTPLEAFDRAEIVVISGDETYVIALTQAEAAEQTEVETQPEVPASDTENTDEIKKDESAEAEEQDEESESETEQTEVADDTIPEEAPAAPARVELDFTGYVATDDHVTYLYDAADAVVLVKTDEIDASDGVAVTGEIPADIAETLVIAGDGEYAAGGATYAVTGLVLPERAVSNAEETVTIATANDEATLLNVEPVFEETAQGYADIFSLFQAAESDPSLIASIANAVFGVAYAEEEVRELQMKLFNIGLVDENGQETEPGTAVHVQTSFEGIEGVDFALYHIVDGQPVPVRDAVLVDDEGRAVGFDFYVDSLSPFALVYYTVTTRTGETYTGYSLKAESRALSAQAVLETLGIQAIATGVTTEDERVAIDGTDIALPEGFNRAVVTVQAGLDTYEITLIEGDTLEAVAGDYAVALDLSASGLDESATYRVTIDQRPADADEVAAVEAALSDDHKVAHVSDLEMVDISIINAQTGEAVEPAGPVAVTLTRGGEAVPTVVHFKGDATEVLEVTADGSFTTESFSAFTGAYTVDFEYVDPETGEKIAWKWPGLGSYKISDIMKEIGVEGEISDVSLVRTVDEGGSEKVLYLSEDETELISEEAFADTFELAMVIDGKKYILVITDDADLDITDLLTSVTITENGTPVSSDAALVKDKLYEIILNFQENDNIQFVDDGALMYYTLPTNVVVPNDSGTFEMDFGSFGKLENCSYSIENGVLKIHWNTSDNEHMSILRALDEAHFEVKIKVKFGENSQVVKWNQHVETHLDVQDAHDAAVTKSGNYDASAEKIYYTVTVNSTGTTTDVVVTDEITGTALTSDVHMISDLEIKNKNGQAVSVSSDNLTVTGNKFVLNLPDMADGDQYVIKYSASVNYGALGKSGKTTYLETNNGVKVEWDESDKPSEDNSYEYDIYFSELSKEATNVSDVYEKDSKKYRDITWKIEANGSRKAPVTYITDTIRADSTDIMKMSGTGITVVVNKEDGSSITRTIPWNNTDNTLGTIEKTDTSWTYIPPTSDGKASYQISYQTTAEVTTLSKARNVNNDVEDNWNKVGNGTSVGPDGEVGITKTATSVTEEEVTWNIDVSIPKSGTTETRIVDVLPSGNNYYWDKYKSCVVTGIDTSAGESYDVTFLFRHYTDQWNYTTYIAAAATDPADFAEEVYINFYYTDSDGNKVSGFRNNNNERTIHVEVITENNPNWLDAADADVNTYGYHTNTAKIGDISASSSVQPSHKKVTKNYVNTKKVTIDGVEYTVYQYKLVLQGITDGSLQIFDTFDTDVFELLTVDEGMDDEIKTWHSGIGHGENIYIFSVNDSHKATLTPTKDGVLISTTDLDKTSSGAYYAAYRIDYYLVMKYPEKAARKAFDAGGKTTFTNSVNWDGATSHVDIDYGHPILDKQVAVNGTEAHYTITINPDKLSLGATDGEGHYPAFLTLTDTFSSSLSIIYDSISVTVNDVEDTAHTVEYDYSGNVGTFKVPNNTKVVISYDCNIINNGKDLVQIWNDANLNGDFVTRSEKYVDISSSASGGGTLFAIKLLKYRENHMELGALAGATFRILDSEKNPIVVTSRAKNPESVVGSPITFTTNSENTINIMLSRYDHGVTLKKNTVYYLEEIEAPAGYQLDSTLYSFVISDDPTHANYTREDGVYVYYIGDILKVKNTPEKQQLTLYKRFEGNVSLTPSQKQKIKFTIVQVDENGDVVANGFRKEINYSDLRYDKYTITSDTDPDFGAGYYKVIEEHADGTSLGLPSNVVAETSYTVTSNGTTETGTTTTIDKAQVVSGKGTNVVFINRYSTGAYYFNKVEAGTEEQPLEGAKFTVYDTSDQQITEYTTGEDGKFMISRQGGGESLFTLNTLYYVKETQAPDGFSVPDPAPKYYFYFGDGVAANAPEGAAAHNAVNLYDGSRSETVVNASETSVMVEKVWVDKKGNELPDSETRDLEAHVTLRRRISKLNGSKVTIIVEDSDTSNEKKITVKDGSVVTLTWNGYYDGIIKVNGGEILIENGYATYTTSTINEDIEINIVNSGWNGGAFSKMNVDYVPPTDSRVESDPVFERNQTLTLADGWYHAWDGLDKVDAEGNTYSYYIEEDESQIPVGYALKYYSANNTAGIQSGTITVTNKKEEEETGFLKIKKTVQVNGSDPDANTYSLVNGDYTFTITRKNDSSFPEQTVTLTINDNKEVVSDEIADLEPGTYIITETPKAGTVLVGATVDGNSAIITENAIEVEVVAGKTGDQAVLAAFTNNYPIIKAHPSVTKAVTVNGTADDAKWPDDLGFTFTLAQSSAQQGVSMPGTATVMATKQVKTQAFDDITFTKAGVYTFTITESKPDVAPTYITYDETPKTVTITIGENAGVLSVTSIKYGGTGSQTDSLTVNNEYSATGSVDFKVNKTFKNGEITADKFSFKLTQVAGNDSTVRATTNVVLTQPEEKATKATSGTTDTVNFTAINFEKRGATDQTGEYWFMLEEVVPTAAQTTPFVDNDIKYDTNNKTWIKVVVEDNGAGALTVKKYDANDTEITGATAADAAFVNEQLISVTAEKKWKNESNAYFTPAGVTVTLQMEQFQSTESNWTSTGDTNKHTVVLTVSADGNTCTRTVDNGTPENIDLGDPTASGYADKYNAAMCYTWDKLPKTDDIGTTQYSYRVTETAEVEGYHRQDGESSGYLTTTATQTITNVKYSTYSLPSTGGVGTGIYYGAGLGLMLLAVLGFVLGARKRSRGEGI